MGYILIIIFGFLEFIFGVYVAIGTKTEWIKSISTLICEKQIELSDNKVILIKRWIGQCLALEGSLYAFIAAITRNYNLSIFVLLLLIIVVEMISYKRIKKGIIGIVEG